MRQGITTVLFDAGNTLVHLDYAFIAEVLGRHGQRRSAAEIRRAEYAAKAAVDAYLSVRAALPAQEQPGSAGVALPGVPESVEALLWPERGEKPSYFAVTLRQLGVDGDRAAPILEALRRSNEQDCLWRVVEPDTPTVLEALRLRGIKLGVVSNSDGRIETDLVRRGLGGHFETVVDSHVVGIEKPDPAIFRIALERVGATAGEALFVGDVFAIDILGARRAGMEAVLLDPLACYPGNPDCRRVLRLGELVELVG